MGKLKILELFGGIGACSKALKNLGIDYEIADYVEIDKYAVKSFNAIFGTNFEPQDICEWDKQIDVGLIMHGSPCQDFSLAGKQAGGDEGSGTRSSLMYETIRIVEKLKPKYVIWENVKNVISKKHRHNFDNYLNKMEELGYKNYWQVLNAKDYGIPQNRERVFTISILGDESFEFPRGKGCNNKVISYNNNAKHQQDLLQDAEGICRCIPAGTHGSTPHLLKTVVRDFEFPVKQELKLKLKDMLEDEVDEKYYLSEKMMNGFIKHNKRHKEKGTGFIWKPKNENDIANTLRANAALCPTDNTIKVIGRLDIKGQDNIKRVYSQNGLSPTLTDMQGGNRQPKVMIKNATKKGYQEATDGDAVNLSYPTSNTRRGRVGKQCSQTLQCNDSMGVIINTYSDYVNKKYKEFEKENGYIPELFNPYNKKEIFDIAPTQTAQGDSITKSSTILKKENLRIRKLTPKECWRLMGFDDEDFEKAEKANSNTQLYKQAGNSIVVNVLMAIFKELL